MHVAAQIAQHFNFSPQRIHSKHVGGNPQLYQSLKTIVELRIDTCAKGGIYCKVLYLYLCFQWIKNGAGKAKERRQVYVKPDVVPEVACWRTSKGDTPSLISFDGELHADPLPTRWCLWYC